MAQKMSKGGIKPPAYPQVEYQDVVQSEEVECRHCGKFVDVPDKVSKEATPDKSVKWTHSCGNIFKIIVR